MTIKLVEVEQKISRLVAGRLIFNVAGCLKLIRLNLRGVIFHRINQ